MANQLRISLGQMDVLLGEPEKNVAKAEEMVAQAAVEGSDLIVFPELWSTGYDLARAGEHATPPEEGVFAETAGMAREQRINVVGSCLSQLGHGRVGNTAVWFDRKGLILGSYNKIHLFHLMNEEQYLTPGEKLTIVSTPWGKAGLAICYDLRFPEIFRHYALSGVGMIVLPSEWPHPRLNHWRILLRARAIENQCFIIACNRVGGSGRDRFFGHSTVIDPWGETVEEAGEEEGLVSTVIDLEKVDEVRRRIRVFEDRRPELYS